MKDIEGILLSRDEFREQVFARDKYTCVFCGSKAQDAHHIMERRLWPDGGYYLDNGASVCGKHHIECEQTTISVEQVLEACGIKQRATPPHLYADQVYDKWGNPILPNGQRLRGELFFDESVNKALRDGKVLAEFTHYVKYPRTHHLPWSPGITDDDRVHPNTDFFKGKEVVVTEKMDGENTTLYPDYIHARSVDSRQHPSRTWVKTFWAKMSYDIPEGWRVCGENLYAKHSVLYSELPSYFLGFSIWNETNTCLDWDATLEWFNLLGIIPVRTLYRGIYDEEKIKSLRLDWYKNEGYVMRICDEFPYSSFRQAVGKFVRKDHVQTVKHWMHGQPIEPNGLKENE